MLGEPTYSNGGEVFDRLRTRQAPPPEKGDFIEKEPSVFDPDLDDVIDLLLREEDKSKVEKAPYTFEGEREDNPWQQPYNDDPFERRIIGEQWVAHGGSVGHAPWHKPTGQQQPQQQLDTPQPQVGGAQTPGKGQPNPMKGPRGLPSVAPRTMDPAFMQQQMMQRAMMGQQQQRPRMEEGGLTPKIPEQFLEELKRKDFHKLLEKQRRWKEDYERRKNLAPTQEAAQGGIMRMGAAQGSFIETDPDFGKTREEIIAEAGLDSGPSVLDFVRPRAEIIQSGITPDERTDVDKRDITYGGSGLYQGDKWYGGGDYQTGNVKVNVQEDGNTVYDDTMSKRRW